MNIYSDATIVSAFANLSFQHVGASDHDQARIANTLQDIRHYQRHHRLIAP